MTTRSAEMGLLPEIIAERVGGALACGNVESQRLAIAHVGIAIAAERDVAPFALMPFEHLQTPDDHFAPALRIEVAALRARDARAMDLDGVPESGVVFCAASTVVHLNRHAATFLDREAHVLQALVRCGDGIASWHRAKPLQVPLSIFFADRAIDLMHAGLVSLRGSGALIAGAGGSGKSTLAVASLLEGLDFLGDDCVAVREATGGFEGHSIFGSSCLEREHLGAFPLLGGVSAGAAEEKAVVPVARLFPGRMASSTALRAVVLPRVSPGERVTVRPATAKEALLALAPSSILRRAIPAADALARMARLVRALPCYRLEMGAVGEAGRRVRGLLEELGS